MLRHIGLLHGLRDSFIAIFRGNFSPDAGKRNLVRRIRQGTAEIAQKCSAGINPA
jgi:hypothetical protein